MLSCIFRLRKSEKPGEKDCRFINKNSIMGFWGFQGQFHRQTGPASVGHVFLDKWSYQKTTSGKSAPARPFAHI